MSLFLTLFITTSLAQDTCEAIVQQAIETASENCDGLRRNQACYGNVTIDAEAAPDVEDFVFSNAGDIVNVSDIASLRLSSQVEETGEWGISIMQVPVITDEGTETAQFVLFGDVEITNASDSEEITEPTTIELTATGNLNVREGPSTSNAVVGTLTNGQTITAVARNEARDWVQFVQENGSMGWIFVPLLTTDGDVNELSIVDANAGAETETQFGAMQAFTFESFSGLDDSPCVGVPDSGLLIQTPDSAGTITFEMNEVRIDVGSTIFIKAGRNELLQVYVVEGEVRASYLDEFATIPEGAVVEIPMSEELQPNGLFDVRPYSLSEIEWFDIMTELTNEEVVIAEPVDADLLLVETPPDGSYTYVFGEMIPNSDNTCNLSGGGPDALLASGNTTQITISGDTVVVSAIQMTYDQIGANEFEFIIPSTSRSDRITFIADDTILHATEFDAGTCYASYTQFWEPFNE